MNNDLILDNERKFRNCHWTYFIALLCDVPLSIFMIFIMKGAAQERGAVVAFVALGILCLVLYSGYVFIREDKILARLVLRIEYENAHFVIRTFSLGSVSLHHVVDVQLLADKWLKRRRIWPSYIVPLLNHAPRRYEWSAIKCYSLTSQDLRFYWICTDDRVFLQFISGGAKFVEKNQGSPG